MEFLASLMKAAIKAAVVAVVIIAAAGVIARNPALDLNSDSPTLVSVDVRNLRTHVSMLTSVLPPRNFENPGALQDAATYIEQVWRSQGLSVSEQTYQVDRKTYKNLFVSMGPKDAKDHLVIGAHYDVDGRQPGADDNASGVAGLLELTRILAKENITDRRIDFVAYTLEEMPSFGSAQMGSAVHAASLKAEHAVVKLMISLEMIGYFSAQSGSQRFPSPIMKLFYPTRGSFIAMVSSLSNFKVTRNAKELFGKYSKLDMYSMNAPEAFPGVSLSDHSSYWNEGYPAVMITDTAMFRNPNYHKPTDTADSLDYDKMSEVVQGVYGLLRNF